MERSLLEQLLEYWHNGIPLRDLMDASAIYAKSCSMEGLAVYTFVLGQAIVHLQKTGLKDELACKIAIRETNRYADEHKEDFGTLIVNHTMYLEVMTD